MKQILLMFSFLLISLSSPLAQTQFNGDFQGEIHYLNWTLTNPNQVDCVELEFSIDDIHYIVVDSFLPKGKSVYNYKLICSSEIAYYRLKFIYFNGNFEKSKVVKIESKLMVNL